MMFPPLVPDFLTGQQVLERSFQGFISTDLYLAKHIKTFTFFGENLLIDSVDSTSTFIEKKIAKIARYLKPIGVHRAIFIDGIEYPLKALETQYPCIADFETGYLDDRHTDELLNAIEANQPDDCSGG